MSTHPEQDNDKRPIGGPFKNSAELLTQPEQLRQRAEEDGYLFIKGMLPADAVNSVRQDVLAVLDRHGLLDPAHAAETAMGNIERIRQYTAEEIAWNGVGTVIDVYRDVQKLESFHALAQSSAILNMLSTLFGETAFPHPRNIARIMLPHPDVHVTPSHQDYLHVQGSADTWTCWIPLGDVSADLGGLAVLRGSHREGLLGVARSPGAGGLESILCGLGYEWETAAYESGDVLAFHSYTVHKSLPNRIPGKIRLSCDFRYQKISDPIEQASLLPHGPFAWDQLYEGWSRTDLPYYWNNRQFSYKDFDETVRWQKEKIC
ncbi:phytanoyl-CoA dioxygenase family protein [Paenibacillus arenilitoris]|uniref:Phytanoyl-CoA dioxygenase family protein n=1 Tax=Paenibacillus arenilitoris TaxID=2772299 RepID=A0A927CIZ4_9BACL|nr:phytanoyl-CoA dioxygenase family protein [Paenibacillus arenilitoris]MBD2868964.1 phytanoyl-CoA dioxygenase family protein [Paenibacillus arenilitoris]